MSFLIVAFFLTTAMFFIQIAANSTTTAGVEDSAPLFSYTGTTGPTDWGKLNPAYTACTTGKMQSPIDIETNKVVQINTIKLLKRTYYPANATLIDHGFNVEMRLGDGGIFIADGKNYTLTQLHWHTPSEHRINGVRFEAELHLVHTASDGSRTVISILYRMGSPDPLLGEIVGKLSQLAKQQFVTNQEPQLAAGALDSTRLIKAVHLHRYYQYAGSLTTPPCTENVVWRILVKERTISSGQIAALRAPLVGTCKRNARPPQPLNGRKVELFEDRH